MAELSEVFEMVEPAIGQVWEVSWDSGDVMYPGVAGRRGVLLGIDIEQGEPKKLWFSCPMVKGQKTNAVHVRDWPPPHSKLIGVLLVYGPEYVNSSPCGDDNEG